MLDTGQAQRARTHTHSFLLQSLCQPLSCGPGAEVSVSNILCSYILEGFFYVYLPKREAYL